MAAAHYNSLVFVVRILPGLGFDALFHAAVQINDSGEITPSARYNWSTMKSLYLCALLQ